MSEKVMNIKRPSYLLCIVILVRFIFVLYFTIENVTTLRTTTTQVTALRSHNPTVPNMWIIIQTNLSKSLIVVSKVKDNGELTSTLMLPSSFNHSLYQINQDMWVVTYIAYLRTVGTNTLAYKINDKVVDISIVYVTIITCEKEIENPYVLLNGEIKSEF